MPSQLQSETSRANGARSRGPKTPEGKRRSSQNARRHGLLANLLLLDNESQPAFEADLAAYLRRLHPADDVAAAIVYEMVAAQWRMQRAWAVEARLLQLRLSAQPPDDQMTRVAKAFEEFASSNALSLLHRYETRLHNTYRRALHTLLLLDGFPREDPAPDGHHPDEPGPSRRARRAPSRFAPFPRPIQFARRNRRPRRPPIRPAPGTGRIPPACSEYVAKRNAVGSPGVSAAHGNENGGAPSRRE